MVEFNGEIEIIEPAKCPTIYCSGAARAFVSGGDVHILYFIEQPGVFGVERVANLRVVMRVDALAPARKLVDEALREGRPRLDG